MFGCVQIEGGEIPHTTIYSCQDFPYTNDQICKILKCLRFAVQIKGGDIPHTTNYSCQNCSCTNYLKILTFLCSVVYKSKRVISHILRFTPVKNFHIQMIRYARFKSVYGLLYKSKGVTFHILQFTPVKIFHIQIVRYARQ